MKTTCGPKLLLLIVLLGLASCDDKPSSSAAVPIDQADVDIDALPPTTISKPTKLIWPAEFSDWQNQSLEGGDRLPSCRSGWSSKPIDDEFVLWKCEAFEGLSLKEEGELAVHTRNGRVFMLTATASFDSPEKLARIRAKVERVNETREQEIPKRYEETITKLWKLSDYLVLMSAGGSGLSLLYMKELEDLDAVFALLDRQKSFARTGRRYRIGDLDYKIEGVEAERFVGRGRERWDARQDSDFIVIEYEVRNRSRTVVHDDPAQFTLIGSGQRLTPDKRAERAFFSSDRTGKYLLPLDYRKKRQRVRIFEVEKEISKNSMILVLSKDGDKEVFELDLNRR